jgi:hypothetical protein
MGSTQHQSFLSSIYLLFLYAKPNTSSTQVVATTHAKQSKDHFIQKAFYNYDSPCLLFFFFFSLNKSCARQDMTWNGRTGHGGMASNQTRIVSTNALLFSDVEPLGPSMN